jgi:hypothetical protein
MVLLRLTEEGGGGEEEERRGEVSFSRTSPIPSQLYENDCILLCLNDQSLPNIVFHNGINCFHFLVFLVLLAGCVYNFPSSVLFFPELAKQSRELAETPVCPSSGSGLFCNCSIWSINLQDSTPRSWREGQQSLINLQFHHFLLLVSLRTQS